MYRGPGWRRRYSDSLLAGRSGDRIPAGGGGEIFRSRTDRPRGPTNLPSGKAGQGEGVNRITGVHGAEPNSSLQTRVP